MRVSYAIMFFAVVVAAAPIDGFARRSSPNQFDIAGGQGATSATDAGGSLLHGKRADPDNAKPEASKLKAEKADVAKSEAPKVDTPKANAPKADTAKSDAAQPGSAKPKEGEAAGTAPERPNADTTGGAPTHEHFEHAGHPDGDPNNIDRLVHDVVKDANGNMQSNVLQRVVVTGNTVSGQATDKVVKGTTGVSVNGKGNQVHLPPGFWEQFKPENLFPGFTGGVLNLVPPLATPNTADSK